MATKLTWKQMVSQYPNSWVVIKNAVTDGPDVVSGEVLTVKSDTEICDFEDRHDNEGLLFRRTTEGEWNGTIEADFKVTTV